MKQKNYEIFDLWCFKVAFPILIFLVLSYTFIGRINIIELIVVNLALAIFLVFRAINIQKKKKMVEENKLNEEEYLSSINRRHKIRMYLAMIVIILIALYFFIQLSKSGDITHWYEYLIFIIALVLILWGGNGLEQQ